MEEQLPETLRLIARNAGISARERWILTLWNPLRQCHRWQVLGYYCAVVPTGRNDWNGGFDREVCNVQWQRATKKRGIERCSEGYIDTETKKEREGSNETRTKEKVD